jgi:hypothetical protein
MLMPRRVPFLAFLFVLLQISIRAQPNLDAIGPRVGIRAPDFSGIDQLDRRQTLESVLGSEGAMIVFFRSADW